MEKDEIALDHDAAGRLIWAWKRDTPPLDPAHQQELIAARKMTRDESPGHLQSVEGQANHVKQLLLQLERVSQEIHHDRWRISGRDDARRSLV